MNSTNRTICLIFMYNPRSGSATYNDMRVVGRYENTTMEDVPLQMMKDSVLGAHFLYPFHFLLDMHKDLLQKEDMFKGVLRQLDDDKGFDAFEVDPKLIEHLYTKILSPKDIVKDIQEIGSDFGEWKYLFCFEDTLFQREEYSGCIDDTKVSDGGR